MSEIVMVPVPIDRLDEVYGVLGQPGPTPAGWSADEIRRCYQESPPVVANMLKYLAERPDTWVGSDDLSYAVGYSSRQFGGSMGAFQRRVMNRYGRSNPPYSRRWNPNSASTEYKMDQAVADVILDEAA